MFSDNVPFRSLSKEDRRTRIIWAAKKVFLNKGIEEASMEDIALSAGTTKPTVYAHFKSKDELFTAMLDLTREGFRGLLSSPAKYSDEPVEAVTLYCARVIELSSWQEAVAYQRFMLKILNQMPEAVCNFYHILFGQAVTTLAEYLDAQIISNNTCREAELLLSATAGWQLLRTLYGVDSSHTEQPGDSLHEGATDIQTIREVVHRIAVNWKLKNKT